MASEHPPFTGGVRVGYHSVNGWCVAEHWDLVEPHVKGYMR